MYVGEAPARYRHVDIRHPRPLLTQPTLSQPLHRQRGRDLEASGQHLGCVGRLQGRRKLPVASFQLVRSLAEIRCGVQKTRTSILFDLALMDDGFHFPNVDNLWFTQCAWLVKCSNSIFRIKIPPLCPGTPAPLYDFLCFVHARFLIKTQFETRMSKHTRPTCSKNIQSCFSQVASQ